MFKGFSLKDVHFLTHPNLTDVTPHPEVYGWNKCLYLDKDEGLPFTVICNQYPLQPITKEFAIRTMKSSFGLSLQEVEIYGYGKQNIIY